jgi:hypothetical protein
MIYLLRQSSWWDEDNQVRYYRAESLLFDIDTKYGRMVDTAQPDEAVQIIELRVPAIFIKGDDRWSVRYGIVDRRPLTLHSHLLPSQSTINTTAPSLPYSWAREMLHPRIPT